MADNTILNTGTGGDVIATDDISGVKYQRVKIVLGADGVNGGDVSSSNAMPVSDNGSSLTVDGTIAATQSGSWNVGLNAGSNAIGSITNTSFAATQATAANLNATVVGTGTFAVQAAQSGNYTVRNQDGSGNSLASSTTTPAGTEQALIVRNIPSGTQTISGTVTANAGTGTFAVSGTVTANAGTGTMNVSVQNASIPVTDNAGSLTVDNNGTFAVQAAQSGTWNVGTLTSITNTVTVDTELPAAAALADGASNPTAPTVGSAGLVFNGTTWDRIEGASVLDGNGATTYAGVLAVKQVPKRVNPSNLGTATNSAVTVDVTGSHTVTVSIATTTTGTFIIEATADNTNWGNVECFDIFADVWVSGQSITPTAGKVYSVLAGGMRQIRIRTNATLGATVSNFWVLDHSQEFIAGIDTGAAPHNFGYALVHKEGEYATTQTGTALWTPASGKKFVVTDITITSGGTTAGIVTLWQGASGDTTYTVGSDPTIFRGEFAPSTTTRPGVVKSFNVPYLSTTADHILRVTTSAAMTIYVQVNGYEI